jgi:hypothetical protein
MGRTRRTKCLHCRELFRADARNRGRQKYCAQPQCRRASKTASQHHWLGQPQNRDYFRGAENAARVRTWQQGHPGYWKARRAGIKAAVLQDACRVQLTEPEDKSTLLVLQDICRAQGPVLIGLIAHLSDAVLQEDIATTSQRLLQRGRELLAGASRDISQLGGASGLRVGETCFTRTS